MNPISVSLATEQLVGDVDRCRRAGIPYGPRLLRVGGATLGSMGLFMAFFVAFVVNQKTDLFFALVSLFMAILAGAGAIVWLVFWSLADKKRIDGLITAREAAAAAANALTRRRK